jgi:hypothetical protein
MKKIIISLLLVAMISVMMIPAYAAGTSITVAEKTVFAGETVVVDVAIAGNTGFANGKFTVEYDADVLTLTALEVEGKLLENGSAAINVEKATISFASAENITEDGVLFTATFTVKADAEVGKYDVKVAAQDMVTVDEAPVTAEAVKGAVNVACDHEWEWVVDKEPEGKEDGLKHEECKNCGEKRNEGTIIDNPNTGDSTVQTIMMVVSVMGMIGVAGTVSYRRRLSK